MGSYHIIGFLYAILLILISLFMIACEGLFSKEAYIGNWCDILRCKEPKGNLARVIFSALFKCLFILMLLVSLCISAVQIVNLVKQPGLTSFPASCPSDPKIPCIRMTSGSQSLSPDLVYTYNLQNGVNDFREQIFNCIVDKI